MIWVLEDDDSIRDIILYTLQATGFATKGFACPKELWKVLQNEMPKLIILDIMLPDEDGISVLKKLKADVRCADIPVIMATAKGMEIDKVKCLEMGADDYIVKPFGMMELVARVKTVLRRSEKNNAGSVFRFGKLVMNVGEHSVTIAGEPIYLTYKEFELLKIFLSNPRKVFSRDQLYDSVWGSDYMGESRTVDMHIKTLRHKLADYGDCIQTIRNVGYRWEEK
ncbi:MAG: response regulator transcription factor [Clostridia bacterium]|nr:response regulator transcription factor [Clostridia bacterium]